MYSEWIFFKKTYFCHALADRGLFFRWKQQFLLIFNVIFYETDPNELVHFKYLIVIHTSDIQGSFLKHQFWNRLVNMSIWIKFFIAVVSELKNCIFRRFLVCQVNWSNHGLHGFSALLCWQCFLMRLSEHCPKGVVQGFLHVPNISFFTRLGSFPGFLLGLCYFPGRFCTAISP